MTDRYTWRKIKREKGLAGVCQDRRGCDLYRNGEEVGYVRPYGARWYWYGANSSGKHHNSLWDETSYAVIDEAKAELLNYAKGGAA